MTHDATHDDLARLLRWRPRPPADAVPAPASPEPAQVGALLDEIGALRLSLSVDMDMLASAVELRAFDVAAEVVDGERADLAAFTDRASARLSAGAGDDAPPAPVRRGLGRVVRAALPAAPALAAAAALVGVLAGLAPGPRTSAPEAFGASNAGFAELFGLREITAAAGHGQAQALREEVVRVMALAMHDPGAAADALRSLSARVEQVEDDAERSVLRDALVEVARLLAALDTRLDVLVVTDPVIAAVTGPGSTPSPAPLPAPSVPTSPSAADGGGTVVGEPQPASASPTAEPSPSPSSDEEPDGSIDDVLPGVTTKDSDGVATRVGTGWELGS